MQTELAPLNTPDNLVIRTGSPTAVFLPHAKAAERFFDFFLSNIRNPNTRRAYYRAACRFSEWCEARGVHNLAGVRPMHEGGWSFPGPP